MNDIIPNESTTHQGRYVVTPGRIHAEIDVVDEHGAVVASTLLPVDATGHRAWDDALAELGWLRGGDWQPLEYGIGLGSPVRPL